MSRRSPALRLAPFVLLGWSSLAVMGEGMELPTTSHQPKIDAGAYYPGSYYSRAYIQNFPLRPGERPLYFRLRPFRHYGRYEYGYPIEPGLTDGTVQSYRFPYRYKWDFQPTQAPPVFYPNPCDDPLARRYEDLITNRRDPADESVPPPPRPLVRP